MRTIFESDGGSRRVWLWVGAGMLATGSAAWGLCQRVGLGEMPQSAVTGAVPDTVTGGVTGRLEMGFGLILLPVLAGAVVSGALWLCFRSEEKRRFPFWRWTLGSLVAWVLIPPIVVLLRGDSVWAVPMMAVAAAVYASAMQGVGRGIEWGNASPDGLTHTYTETLTDTLADEGAVAPFGLLPVANPGMWVALALAAALEGVAIPLANGWLLVAGLLLAAATFGLLWRRVSLMGAKQEGAGWRRPVVKAAGTFAVALLVTVAALIPAVGVGPIGSKGQGRATPAGDEANAAANPVPDGNGAAGYRGIVLWTEPKKKERMVAPAMLTEGQPSANARKPMVIPFDGSYWYFTDPYTSPGSNPHVGHGDPTEVTIRSTNRLPLKMEAHQSLARPIDLSCCGALEINLQNDSNIDGGIVVGVVLTDTRAPGRPSLALGTQMARSGGYDNAVGKPIALEDRLRYTIPAKRGMQRFDQITVVFFPGDSYLMVGAKVRVEQFVLLPR